MGWGKGQITKQALRSAPEDYAAFEAIGLSAMEGARVLDVGCFDGFNTVLKFAPYRNIARVVGIDPSASDIADAQARTDDPRFSFIPVGFEEYDAAGQRFDVVYFSHVFQHLADPQAAMDKAASLLAPGGFVIVKTTDDEAKLSYPDPDRVMRRLFALYERHVLPNTPHTHATDRYNGQKCYAYMKRAGLGNVRIGTFVTDTAEKDLDARRALFERCVYFRRNVPACVDEAVADEVRALVAAWGKLFEREDYYFCTTTFVAIGQNVAEGAAAQAYAGPAFGGRSLPSRADAEEAIPNERGFSLRPMGEEDIAAVMLVQMSSFSDPWTPLAFALELRHNPCAHYKVAVDGEGQVAGFIGWWEMGDTATIAQVAVDACMRRKGVGRALVEQALTSACEAGCSCMQLEVRAANEGARAFYRDLRFDERGVRTDYYEDPVDDAVLMVRMLP